MDNTTVDLILGLGTLIILVSCVLYHQAKK